MITVGITGGIGSGKSLVCKIFEVTGSPCYYADDRAKALMNEDPELAEKLKYHFGADIYEDGHLNRAKLSGMVFNDPSKLQTLNDIVHPAVGKDFDRWRAQSTSDIVFKEAALLVESGSYKNLDFLICVTAPDETRIKRVMKRDQVSREDVLNRMKNQWKQEEKAAKSDYVIENNGNELLLPKVMRVYEELKQNAKTTQAEFK